MQRTKALLLEVLLMLLAVSALPTLPIAGASPTQSWVLSGPGFYGGSFQNTTIANQSVQLAPRTPPSNRTMILSEGPGSADSQTVGDPFVLRQADGSYQMYYTGAGNGVYSVMLATSPDGFVWTKQGAVLAPGLAPTVMKIAGVYHMWYANFTAGGALGDTYRIYHATSSDAVTWTYQGLALNPGTSGTWDEAIVSNPYVMEDSTGLYRMYYTGWNNLGYYEIGLATSRDLTNWVRYPGNPVLPYGPAGAWDYLYVYGHSIVVLGGTWVMYYDGGQRGAHAVGVATSTDGLNWTKSPSNPVIRAEPYPYWDDGELNKPVLFVNASSPRMYYSGSNGTTWRIGVMNFSAPPAQTSYGTYVSSVFDSAANGTHWLTFGWNATVPAGTTLSVRVRAGNSSSPDSLWTPWNSAVNVVSLPRSRFLQVAFDLTSTSWTSTPELRSAVVTFQWNGAPSATPVTLATGAWTDLSRPVLTWNESDPEGDPIVADQVQLSMTLDFATVAMESGNLTPSRTSWQVPWSLEDGTWYWRVRSQDIYGAWGLWQLGVFRLDTTPPVISLLSPAPGSLLHSNTVDVLWVASDPESGVGRLRVQMDGGTPTDVTGTNSSMILGGVPDGAHTIVVTAYDEAGNQASTAISFTVSTNPWDVNGPYGAGPLAGVVVAVAVAASLLAFAFYIRRRRQPPEPPG